MKIVSKLTRRNAVWLIPLALIVTYPLWHMPLAAFLAPRGGFDPSYGKGEREGYNFRLLTPTIYEYKNGRQSAIIRAKAGYSTQNPDEYALEVVDADIFNLDGAMTHIVAQKGVFQNINRMLTLLDDVVIDKKTDNQQLYSDLLYYDDKKETVTCPGATRLVGEDIEVTGSSFFYDVRSGRSEVGGRVNCLIDQQADL
ncbi:MAG: LPS export ABC transporter periplasmic protein LptC [Desulfobulbaceae bacterium]|jgi:LPS export ABC transporter protein LptC|nr:LPS export ABC transporter periplasmic protein LptC [Desulfobulbaceae bacterium]